MAQTTIRFRIRPDGRVEELVEGIQGAACQQLTERIEHQLGSLQQRRSTSEAFQAAAQSLTTSLSVHQRST
ncbi:DUF2997 domain-containing protein [Synechococcus sp. Cruz-9H2]|jgi:hypothetical protein|uniref:DUF2997 domain-containing protein n=1 Tax=unclassified Synechococcus TaxID=2626047 RepID=UPI0020CFAAF0|nr:MULTISPECIES: DUF2997 domain-containing protein [unclassified Synechococcus]MCP9819066.1 DUF2997 domain-containing protein [Synechococcus sp. Cruz-9H2]MCP9843570.1 DUF2997 domain-containing protein [Synechococcus sp. Edmonson 11F2]MCP9855711.1 DUF2997 domain-containing protein [Synechococcus sp. Cruz-9C9]MCP9863149.1 DUF2997 domain-containing protein [Synechococcus sp. Cruz-7E5]MCP9869976.1 DUF2997 domain-containing protein [Synechococcus sp. Cruz-7B9]